MDTIRNDNFSLRQAREEDWEEAMQLAWKTFLIYEAAEYGPEGVKSFQEFVSAQWLKNMFLDGRYRMLVALDKEKIIGLISLRSGHHISLLFVHKDYHKQGVGSALLEAMGEYMQKETGMDYLTVNAAPYAAGFYHKLGFWDLAPQTKKDGILYIPMKKNL